MATSEHKNHSNGNGTGTSVAIKMLKEQKEHYGSLAATYQQQGMEREAQLFSNIVEKFAVLQEAILQSTSKVYKEK